MTKSMRMATMCALVALVGVGGAHAQLNEEAVEFTEKLGEYVPADITLIDEDGNPQRIDKAFSWEAPLATHGLMHMVIANAWRGDPYPIDTLFMYMANMAWNSAMNVGGTIEMLTAKDPATGEYRIPRIIYSDAYFSETVAYADLVLPDTTYLERWDCISLLDRPICTAEGPADSIRQPCCSGPVNRASPAVSRRGSRSSSATRRPTCAT